MDRSRHLDLALDVEQALLAGVRGRGHAHRKPELVVAQVDDSQPVDLPDALAAHRQQALAVGDRLLQPLLGVVVAVDARLDRRVHVLRVDERRAARSGDLGALRHQRLAAREDRALARLVLGLAMHLLDQRGHRSRREVRQPDRRQAWATKTAVARRVASVAAKLSAKSTLQRKRRANSGSASCTT